MQTRVHQETMSHSNSVVDFVVEFGNKFWPVNFSVPSWPANPLNPRNVLVPVVTATPTNVSPPPPSNGPSALYRNPHEEKKTDDGGGGTHEYIYHRTDSVTGFAVAESVNEPVIPTAIPLDPSHLGGGENLYLPRAEPFPDVRDERSGSLVAGKFQDKAPRLREDPLAPIEDGNRNAAMAAEVLGEYDGMDYDFLVDIDLDNDEDLPRKMDNEEMKIDGAKMINENKDAVPEPMDIVEIEAHEVPTKRDKVIDVGEKRISDGKGDRDSVSRKPSVGGKRKKKKPKKDNGRKKQRTAPKKNPSKGKSPQASAKTNAMSIPDDIRPNDVLSGRSRALQTHPGNIKLRDIVENKYPTYLKAEKTDKTKMYEAIRDSIQDEGGRFWKQDNNNMWVEVKDPDKARDIVSNKFKNKNKELKRENDKKNGKAAKMTRNTAVKRLKASNKYFKRRTEKKPGG